MEKKVFNWFGCILIVAYILILIFLIYICTIMDEVTFVPAALWAAIIMVLIPITLYKTRLYTYPEKEVQAKLITKSTATRMLYRAGVLPQTLLYLYLSFELLDGTKLVLNVKSDIYDNILENDTGILVYKGQGKRNYFVSFEKNHIV